MLASKTLAVTVPGRRKLATALASEIGGSQTSRDLDLLRELMESNVLDRLKNIFEMGRTEAPADERAIRLPEVLRVLSISKSAWYDRLNSQSPAYDQLAPQPFKLGKSERSPSVWWHSEIIAYLEICAAASRTR
ncbi:helix-turn-helix transcriptional regulator [Stenotrophomonas maltophilia]|uniref:helix-turn-helix transcriptional regulator n=1 Tax=Stenotrophomonas maltophilia TaxID=40324 RepID=UPI000C1566E6|nr:AlpA family phage regulatory protein [Stenotrophomonas maltophilia]